VTDSSFIKRRTIWFKLMYILMERRYGYRLTKWQNFLEGISQRFLVTSRTSLRRANCSVVQLLQNLQQLLQVEKRIRWITTTLMFFKKVQNKIHYAVHGQTAAEVIYSRADAEKEFMGLHTFRGDRPHLVDAKIAKNYLNEKELRAMGQIVSGYLDFAERQAEREIPMTMADWATHLDRILTMSGEKLLEGNGSILHQQAMEKATDEYRKYSQRTLSAVEEDYLDSLEGLKNTVQNKKKNS